MKNIYKGNVYKLTNTNIEYERQKNICVKYFGDLYMKDELKTRKFEYELYMENALLLKISDNQYSNYVLLKNNIEEQLVYSYIPVTLGSLFIYQEDLKLHQNKDDQIQTTKILTKKNKSN